MLQGILLFQGLKRHVGIMPKKFFLEKYISFFYSFHDTFMSCIGTCEETFAREAVLNGQESWISICHAFRTDDEFINFILPCWAENGDQLSKKCHIHALMVQNSVVDLMQNQLRDIQNNLADLCR